MPHPLVFDENDPVLARLRGIALAFPSAQEKISHGRPAFFTTKVFGYFGWLRADRDDTPAARRTLVVLLDAEEREPLLADPRCFHPAYLGPSGWIAIDLPSARAKAAAWAEIGELLDASYRNTAGKRLVAELDVRVG